MPRIALAVVLAIVVAGVAATSTSASLGWWAAWNCQAPCTLGVQIDPAFPASEKALILQEMAAWSAAPEIDLVEAKSAKIKINVGNDGFTTAMTFNRYIMQKAVISIDQKWFGTSVMAFDYCHELGHALGFDDGAPSTPDVCPTADHFALLSIMYPIRR